MTVRPDGKGLTYRDETPIDRDRHGVLWARITEAPGEGRPDFRAMHPAAGWLLASQLVIELTRCTLVDADSEPFP